ncbi:hypothetical protein [Legionella jordanis]|uniref:Uncharacterized protein n=1 Tax=Legionella jordanis TaxID=456 RepID=A0A0W0VER0_9GAMM|nr:hypothetical protein [Legionella jordanis]KTD18628.1 hypothetical protein Ljor_0292 [Legionella jordanis]VEH11504.1 Uncharacterised protein [Legionella jordanis]
MKNKNVGIATMIIVILVAILGFIYFDNFSTPVTKKLDSTPDVPVEAPEPTNNAVHNP